MKRKIFLSIGVPELTKKSLGKATERWKDLPVKWVKKENLHLTLLFLGYLEDADALKVAEKVKETVKDFPIFDIDFTKINLGPKIDDPSVIWLSGEPDETLKNLCETLEKSLHIFTQEKKAFRPHITLGRLRKNLWKDLSPQPVVDADYTLTLEAESVLVLASGFSEGDNGGEYAILEHCPLL